MYLDGYLVQIDYDTRTGTLTFEGTNAAARATPGVARDIGPVVLACEEMTDVRLRAATTEEYGWITITTIHDRHHLLGFVHRERDAFCRLADLLGARLLGD